MKGVRSHTTHGVRLAALPMPGREVRTRGQGEAGFQRTVIEYAKLNGWLVAHFRPALTKSGHWRTAVQADGCGFPDLTLVRERVVFIELKAEAGRLSVAQKVWLHTLQGAGAEVYIWRPSDWVGIETTLRRA